MATRLACYSSAPASGRGNLPILTQRQVAIDKVFQNECAAPSKELGGFRTWAHTHPGAMKKFELMKDFIKSTVQRELSCDKGEE